MAEFRRRRAKLRVKAEEIDYKNVDLLKDSFLIKEKSIHQDWLELMLNFKEKLQKQLKGQET